MSEIADTLRELADKLEKTESTGCSIPTELKEACSGTVYDVEAEGWNIVTDYVIAFDNDNLNIESRNISRISELDGYYIKYVSWGDRTETESSVELNVSEVGTE